MAKRKNSERMVTRRPEARQDSLAFVFIIAVGLLLAVGIGIMIGMTIAGARDRTATRPGQSAPAGDNSASQLAALEARVNQNPNDAGALYDLAFAYHQKGEYQKAIGYYERALALRPNDLNIMTDLGTAYYDSGNPDKGLDYYASALKIDPKFEQALFNRGVVLLYGKKDKAAAAEALQKYLSLYPNGQDAPKARKMLQETK